MLAMNRRISPVITSRPPTWRRHAPPVPDDGHGPPCPHEPGCPGVRRQNIVHSAPPEASLHLAAYDSYFIIERHSVFKEFLQLAVFVTGAFQHLRGQCRPAGAIIGLCVG